jgi:acetylglutamate kinase
MIPKVEACLDSLRAGVRKTHMIDGRDKHALLLEIHTHQGIGTEIVLENRNSELHKDETTKHTNHTKNS